MSALFDYISPKHKNAFLTAALRIFAFQNSDGSWGKDKTEKTTLTAQMIQLMHALDFKKRNNRFLRGCFKAEKWMESNVKLGEGAHWCTRLEVGLLIGDYDELLAEGWIKQFVKVLNYDLEHGEKEDKINLFWHVLPTLMALLPHEHKLEEPLPHDRVIEKVMKLCETYDGKRIAVKHHPNHTGLVALYLFKLAKSNERFAKYEETAIAMANWLLENMTESDDDDISWLDSKSITSYVIIDLLQCLPLESLSRYITRIFSYLSPNENGIVPGDSTTTYKTKLHSGPIYATILVLRAYITLIKHAGAPEDLKDFYTYLVSNKSKFIKFKTQYLLEQSKTLLPWILCLIFSGAGVALYFFKQNEAASICLSTGVAAALGLFFDHLKRGEK